VKLNSLISFIRIEVASAEPRVDLSISSPLGVAPEEPRVRILTSSPLGASEARVGRSPTRCAAGHAGGARKSPQATAFSFAEYQAISQQTATYPDRGGPLGLAYITAGLAAEAGEVAGKIAKGLRDANGFFDVERKTGIKSEVGDVLWFLSEICTHMGIPLEDAADWNVRKLHDRMSRGVLGGSGDDR
jgi:NTP pyrophosphatase (non-canonical NTP hydrolase)